jgi:hypothetical protein
MGSKPSSSMMSGAVLRYFFRRSRLGGVPALARSKRSFANVLDR